MVTTDPVELWAAPHSRSRIERQYFDYHFEPFYRIEQLIIRAKDLENVSHNTSKGVIVFGPAFNKDFLLEVHSLQESIKNLDDGSLAQICYAPLVSSFTNPATIDKCVVQSIWGYFQDDVDTFDETDEDDNGFELNYLDHLLKCMKTPYNPDCLAPYGGPVDPAIALGGFLKPGESLSDHAEYEKANTVILTFLVKNHFDKSKLEPAKSWEEIYVNFMKNYTNSTKSEHLDIAFTSERSIEVRICSFLKVI